MVSRHILQLFNEQIIMLMLGKTNRILINSANNIIQLISLNYNISLKA